MCTRPILEGIIHLQSVSDGLQMMLTEGMRLDCKQDCFPNSLRAPRPAQCTHGGTIPIAVGWRETAPGFRMDVSGWGDCKAWFHWRRQAPWLTVETTRYGLKRCGPEDIKLPFARGCHP
jgi:hypothetical protein